MGAQWVNVDKEGVVSVSDLAVRNESQQPTDSWFAREQKRGADWPPIAFAPFDSDDAQRHQDAWAEHLKLPLEETNSIGMKLRLIPPGEFAMGASLRYPRTRRGADSPSAALDALLHVTI